MFTFDDRLAWDHVKGRHNNGKFLGSLLARTFSFLSTKYKGRDTSRMVMQCMLICRKKGSRGE